MSLLLVNRRYLPSMKTNRQNQFVHCRTRFLFIVLVIFFITDNVVHSKSLKDGDKFLSGVFPKGFKWGVGSSAFQIEGSWQADSKGESIWDKWSHDHPEKIADRSNADVSCDSYRKYKEDVLLVKALGAKVYRFSISWSRILPKGTTEVVNKEGLKYYDDLINELLSQGIEPMITLFHFDLPQNLQEGGGFLNKETIMAFGDYARLVYQTYGDRVKLFTTVNEPFTFCIYGYDKAIFAPGINNNPAENPYSCVHSLILGHALAYRIYNEEFKEQQKGKVGISLDNFWQEPLNSKSDQDKMAAEQSYSFRFDWIAFPLFRGEYPTIMRKIVGKRLPTFDKEWVQKVNGSLDFLGINHFSTELVTFANPNKTSNVTNWESDSGTVRSYDPKWPNTGSEWLKVFPEGIRKSLNKIKKDFKNPEVIITENGMSDPLPSYEQDEEKNYLIDTERIQYHRQYINELFKAIQVDGCNVTGYIAWSLFDSFSWNMGYTQKFGIYHVDQTSPNKTRTPKMSAKTLREIFISNGFPSRTRQKFNAVSVPANFSPSNVLLCSAPFAVIFSAYYAYGHL